MSKTLNKLAACTAVLASFVLAGCAQSGPAAPATGAAAEGAAAAPTAAADPAPAAAGDIVDIAAGNPDFSTLVAAVQAAGLDETLKGAGPFTVFAPTNAAFEKLPPGTVDNLLKPENKDQLVAILTYHVVPGRVLAADVTGTRSSPATVQGATLSVDGSAGVKVNNATVLTPDIVASNGVIHVIDTVLLPPAR